MQVSALPYYYAFGSPMPTRSWSDPNAKYKYGLNGKEKDNEINVDGGDYDFGARIYDSRLGRWLSLDPLLIIYSGFSPYNFCFNNPLIFIDPDGKQVTFMDKDSRKAYNKLKSAYKKMSNNKSFSETERTAAKAQYDNMIRIEKAENLIVNVNAGALGSNDATLRYNSECSKDSKDGVVVLDLLIHKVDKKDTRIMLADELTHAGQFLDGEIGFKIEDGKSYVVGYDAGDESESQLATIIASSALKLPLNELQNDFLNLLESDFIKKHYPSLKNTKKNT